MRVEIKAMRVGFSGLKRTMEDTGTILGGGEGGK
jgi:hypothetical protein